MESIYLEVKRDKQIWKFCFYGLLKNLRFFEPYLLIYLLSLGMNLFQIGILISIREFITYIFEVPSGIIADNYGKKRELMMCFTFYIISFVFFFIGINYFVLIIAMIFFGLGEAFRSGTHKAMIYSYLEQKDWFKYKAFVYGRTRSFSLIGSAISAFLSIVFVLNLPGVRWVFLICIIPYILDFLLIWTYPNSLDEREKTEFRGFFKESIIQLKSIFSQEKLNKILISSSLYDGLFKSIKDYIQPILSTIILSTTILQFKGFTQDDKVTIYLGIVYGVFYIFSSMASKNVYKLNEYMDSYKLMGLFFDIMAIFCIIISFGIRNELTILIIVVYFVMYLLKDARRPLVVDTFGDHMNKSQRATVLSVDSQLKSLFLMIFAPLLGFISDKFSLQIMFLFIGVFILIANRFLSLDKKINSKK
ncbi:MFS transporter [Clostridium sp. DL1XJH146]